MRALLDSEAYSRLMRGDAQIADLIRGSEEVLISVVVVGELLSGFRIGSRFESNLANLLEFLDNPFVTVVPVSTATADSYSRIAASLRAKGRPIPTNDMWIAAQAMETGAELISADGHFENVEGIAWIRTTA